MVLQLTFPALFFFQCYTVFIFRQRLCKMLSVEENKNQNWRDTEILLTKILGG